MNEPLTIGELHAIRAIVATHGPTQSRDRLAKRLDEQIRAIPQEMSSNVR